MRPSLSMMILIASASSIAIGAEERISGFSGSLGIGVASLHDYVGGGETRVQPALLGTLQQRTRFGTFALDTKGLSWTPLDTGTFRVGVLASYDAGRTDEEPANINYRPGSDYLRGMGDIDGAPVAGAFVGWTLGTVTADLSVRRLTRTRRCARRPQRQYSDLRDVEATTRREARCDLGRHPIHADLLRRDAPAGWE